jgi:hypothetical protein
MHFCGVAESFGSGSAQLRLASNRVTFRVDSDLPGFSRVEFEDACMEAWKRWSRVIGVTADKHSNPKTDPTQYVVVMMLDGAGGVLADQVLPYGQPPYRMRVDSVGPWVIADNPPPGKINLLAVLCHEDGHCLGMQHIDAKGTPDLMNPTYNARIIEPQEDDISYGRKLYGPPQATSPPSTPGVLPVVVTVEQGGKRWSGQIPRVA